MKPLPIGDALNSINISARTSNRIDAMPRSSATLVDALKRLAAAAAVSVVVGGCSSRPSAITPPAVDADDLSEAILEDRDQDSSGGVSSAEAAGLPALAARFADYDADGNGEISLEELQARMARIFDGETGLMAAACRVTRNGRPLVGAIVHFVPVSYLDGIVPVASGITLANGTTVLSIQLADLPPNAPQRQGLIRPGLYAVEVTHPEFTIPEQYNVKTTLGCEVSPAVALAGAIDLPLKF